MIAAFDLDGTLLKNNSSYAFCQFLCQKGFFSKKDLAYCTYLYVKHRLFGLSLWDLHCLVFERLFQGVSVAQLQTYIEPFLNEIIDTFWYQPALARLKNLQAEGFDCAILSNSPSFLVNAIAQKLMINTVFATQYHCNSQGELVAITTLMDGLQKAKALQSMTSSRTIAFSDSPLDLPFLEAAHVAVAANPTRSLRRIAKTRGWEII